MSILSLLALLPSFVYTAAVQLNRNAISSQINGSSILVHLANATELGIIDPRFSITPHPGRDDISPTSTYMNTINLMGYLALGDFDGHLTRTERRSQYPWDDVEVSVRPVDGRPLEQRFVIWGLFEAIYSMSQNSFTNGDFDLNYDEQFLGIVRYRETGQRSLEAGGSDGMVNSSSSSLTTDTSLEVTITTKTTYTPGGEDIPSASIYISLASALIQVAQNDRHALMSHFWLGLAEFDTTLEMIPGERSMAPFLTIANAIGAVWSVARFITHEQRFAEFSTLIRASGTLIGVMAVHKGQPEAQPPAVQRPNPVSPSAVDTA